MSGQHRLLIAKVSVDASLVGRIKASKSLETLKELHAAAVRSGDEKDKYVANTLVDMYAKLGSMGNAREVFERMQKHDIVSWNALLFGYAENGEELMALEIFELMASEMCIANARSFVAALKACTSLASKEEGDSVKLRSLEQGMSIHSHARMRGCDSNIFVECTLVDMYAKCRSLADAQRVFDRMLQHNVATWNALLFGYAENGEEMTLQLFERMQHEGCEPSARSFVAALNACASIALKEEGVRISDKLVKLRSLEKAMAIHFVAAYKDFVSNTYVSSTLVDMYAKCGSIADAQRMFDSMQRQDVVAWNALILGYVEHGQGKMALDLLAKMQCPPDALTIAAAVKVCICLAENEQSRNAKAAWLEKGMAIHSHAVSICDLQMVNTSLVAMYGKCGSMADAQKVFDRMNPDIVSWNALLFGYVENGRSEYALELFVDLQNQGYLPDALTFIAALKACGIVVALETGRGIHAQINKCGLVRSDPFVAASLVDFYCKCGSMVEAEQVFNSLPKRDLVTWNALVCGYSLTGESNLVFETFERMQDAGMKPDGVTFLCVLNACNHAGLVEKGKEYFGLMSFKFSIRPGIEHYSCLIGLLVRANKLDEAGAMLSSMPFEADAVLWMTILGACSKSKNAEVGKLAFDSLLALHQEDATAYVLMANIYESLGMKQEKSEVEASLLQLKRAPKNSSRRLITPSGL